MALHTLFEDKTKRAFFETAFQEWHERTTKQLQLLRENPKEFAFTGQECTQKLHEALEKLEKTAKGIERQKDSVSAIIDTRAKVSDRVATIQQGIEANYGENNPYIGMNTNMALNSLSAAEQAMLYVNFNVVGQLAQDDSKVVSIVGRRAAKDNLIGPQRPEEGQQQEAAAPSGQQLG